MIDSILMLVSLVILGYPFYISSKMLWMYKSEKGFWKWIYGLVTVFLICTYFIFSLVFFAFVASFFITFELFDLIRIVLGVFFLSGAGLIGAMMKYHIYTLKTALDKTEKAKKESKKIKELRDEIEELRKELESEKKFHKFSVDRELKMIELKKKIKELED